VRSGLPKRGAGMVLALVAIFGCATVSPRTSPPAEPEPALAGWQALAEGRGAEAEGLFAASLDAARLDPIRSATANGQIARFGRAALAYERGASVDALDDYAAVLVASATLRDQALVRALAPVAAARVLALYDEVGLSDQARMAQRLRPVELARAPGLPWLARVDLARLGDHIARQAGDADALARGAAEDGCAASVFEIGSLGPFPHLDLDRAAAPAGDPPPRQWRPLSVSGCHLDAPPSSDGRGQARLLRAAIEVGAGQFEIVLDFDGEARLSVDGGTMVAHGGAAAFGPSLTATRVALAAGRHEITVRTASRVGQTRLGLWVLPEGAGPPVRFVDPRVRVARAAPPQPAVAAEETAVAPLGDNAGSVGARALGAYCAAFAADRVEAVDDLAAALERLVVWPRFAIGSALVGEISRHDPTRPATFARDAARRSLRAAVGVDETLARGWQTLAAVELEDERTREAIDDARRARTATPGWWAPDLLLARALAARGLDFDADRALAELARETGVDSALAADRAVVGAPCAVIEALRGEAQERRRVDREEKLGHALVGCGGDVEARAERARARGELWEAISLLRGALRLDPDRDDLAGELALLLAANGQRGEDLAELAALVARDPRDPMRRVRLADAQAAAGELAVARATIETALTARPDVPEVRRSARALGVSLPLDGFRVDGRAAIRAFEAVDGHYAAPAVIVLDRGVTRVFDSGATMMLTHEIVRVDSKDAIDRWGEIEVPPGAEILTLRTHKPDGSTREPEEIAGKETISAADLAIGDYLEWELLETHSPSEAFAPGFLGDRFYFQSFDAPMARSELVLVTPTGVALEIDRHAGAPQPEVRPATDGTRVTSFTAIGVPQLFAERSAVPAIEFVPSVRASSGVGWGPWARYIAEELHDAVRASPEVRALARKLGRGSGQKPVGKSTAGATQGGAPPAVDDRARVAAAIVDWVTENVESSEDLAEPASTTLARGRGSRVALALSLAAELGVPARAVLARSRLVADAAAPAPPEELEDFSDTLVAFDVGTPDRPLPIYADLRLRHAAFGYVPPGLDGARTLSLPDGAFSVARSTAPADRRTIDMTIRLDERGGGVAVATEDLAGWPALEWAELLDRFGTDRARLRQDFEQRSLGVQFPGARLRDLDVELPRDAGGRIGTARVRYSFVSAHLAVPVDRGTPGPQEMRLEPTFFRSQPGRRFAAEPQRSTALMLGFDVPVQMTATLELPGAAHLDPPRPGQKDLIVSRNGGYRFVEERGVEPGRPNVIVLHRESALPIMRVSPGEYAAVAADLRRVDGAEQAEIRIRLGAAGHGTGIR
jgi:cellulose synthase operon protein C